MVDQDNKQKTNVWKYLSGEMSQAEEEKLNSWLSESSDNQEFYKKCVGEFYRIRWSHSWETIEDKTAYRHIFRLIKNQKKSIFRLKYAAIGMLFILSGIGIWQLQKTSRPVSLVVTKKETIVPPANVPILTLADGKRISIFSHSQTIHQTENINVQLTDSGSLEYIPLPDTSRFILRYNHLTTPRGCEFHLTLSDGSRIWMNADSKLKYPETFARDKREIYLSGEAYFEITPDKTAPFIVHTQDMELQVLGTTFNIQAYEDEKKIITTLVSGKVSQYYARTNQRIALNPSHQSVFDRSSRQLQIHNADIDEVLAWKNGKIIANNQRLEDIFHQLARWYDFKVVYTHPSLKDIRFYLHCQRYENIRPILAHIQQTHGIRFSFQEDTIYISQ